MSESQKNNQQWWLGMADLATSGLSGAAEKIERVHLSIADETFNILKQVPTTRPVSEPVRFMHHGISRICYRGIAGGSRLINRAIR